MINQVRLNTRSNGQPGCSMNTNPLAPISRTIEHDGSWLCLSRLLICKRASRCIRGGWSAFGHINGGLHAVERMMPSHYQERDKDEASKTQTTPVSSCCSARTD